MHGAGSVVFDTKAEEVSDGTDFEVIYHHARLVRGGEVLETPDGDPSAFDPDRVVVFPDGDTGGGGGDAGAPPDMAVVAEQLGIAEEVLIAALGEPRVGQPDIEAAAAALGITAEELEAALMDNSGPTE